MWSEDPQRRCGKNTAFRFQRELMCSRRGGFRHSQCQKWPQKLRPNSLVAGCCRISWRCDTNTNTVDNTKRCHTMRAANSVAFTFPTAARPCCVLTLYWNFPEQWPSAHGCSATVMLCYVYYSAISVGVHCRQLVENTKPPLSSFPLGDDAN